MAEEFFDLRWLQEHGLTKSPASGIQHQPDPPGPSHSRKLRLNKDLCQCNGAQACDVLLATFQPADQVWTILAILDTMIG